MKQYFSIKNIVIVILWISIFYRDLVDFDVDGMVISLLIIFCMFKYLFQTYPISSFKHQSGLCEDRILEPVELYQIDDISFLRECCETLWTLLDDIDTADDIFKSDNENYRKYVQERQKLRHRWLSSDGYKLYRPAGDKL